MFLREIPLRGGCSISCGWSPPALANSKQMWRPSSEEKAARRDEWMPPTWVPWHALTSLLCCFWGGSELSARLVGIQSTHVISKLEIKPTFYLKENVLNRYEKNHICIPRRTCFIHYNQEFGPAACATWWYEHWKFNKNALSEVSAQRYCSEIGLVLVSL